MYKLLMKAFPGLYSSNSVYALFPFTIPEENRKILQRFGEEHHYDFEKPLAADYRESPSPSLWGRDAVDLPEFSDRLTSEVLGECPLPYKPDMHTHINTVDATEDTVMPLREGWNLNERPMQNSTLRGNRRVSFANRSISRTSTRSSSDMNDDALISAKQLLTEATERPGQDINGAIRAFYEKSMSTLIRRKSLRLRNTYQLDAVHE